MTAATPIQHIVVIGFGLIGASVAAALKHRRPSAKVVAVDRADVIGKSSVARWSDRQVSSDDASGLKRALASCELALLAAPVGVIARDLPEVLKHARLVSDCGSTKRQLVDVARHYAEADRFVPGHPMAGSPESGAEHADPDLFRDRRWILCSDLVSLGSTASDNLARMRGFVSQLDAVALEMSAAEHDRSVALSSHLPRLVASSIHGLVSQQDALSTAGPGSESLRRLAGGNPDVWRDILTTNADQVAAALDALDARLGAVASALRQGDIEPALELLKSAVTPASR